MQKAWNLRAHDGYTIHGLLNQLETGKSDKAVLLVHGMTGSPEEIQHAAAATYFAEQGYDVLRPYLYCLYCTKENCRRFQDATITLHAQDINTITTYFSSQYRLLYAAGHSYGAPSLLTADTHPFAAISLWDPSLKVKAGLSTSFIKDNTTQNYVIAWDNSVIVGQPMLNESLGLDRAYGIALAEKCQAPVQVIFAGDGDYVTRGESYHSFVKTKSDMKIVPGTEHCFIEPGTTEPLLRYTHEWFEKFQP